MKFARKVITMWIASNENEYGQRVKKGEYT